MAAIVSVAFVPASPATAQSSVAGGAQPTLTWDPCVGRDGFECATATVPLDHSVPLGPTIDLAVMRRPATDQANRIGSLFMNPGGPGGSGVDALGAIWSLFPPAVQARFDLVSWDPRGVGRSQPVQCFDSAAEEDAFLAPVRDFPTTPAGVATLGATMLALGQQCETRMGSYLEHVSTVDTAQDLDWLRRAVGDAALNYWGMSYGTYLGEVYASLYPQTLRALILDSNVDPVAWNDATVAMGTPLRIGSDIGSGASLEAFLSTCGDSIPGSCAFSAGSAAATGAKFDQMLALAAVNPIDLPNGMRTTPPAIISAIVDGLYSATPVPGIMKGWPALAEFLQTIWVSVDGVHVAGEAEAIAAAELELQSFESQPYGGIEQMLAIMCAETPGPAFSLYESIVPVAVARSGVVGAHWTWTSAACPTWPRVAAHTYTGPWTMSRSVTPLLLNTTIDPATPYQGAQLAAARLDGVLVTVEGYGHGVITNPSACANAIAAAYLLDGTVPSEGVVCAQDTPPFPIAPTPVVDPTPEVPRFAG